MDEKQFEQLSGKVETIIKLLAMNLVEGKDFKNQVLTLSAFGFQPKQIAEALGKPGGSVRSILHRYRLEQGEEEQVSSQETKTEKSGEEKLA